jgi:hypothetical protein
MENLWIQNIFSFEILKSYETTATYNMNVYD